MPAPSTPVVVRTGSRNATLKFVTPRHRARLAQPAVPLADAFNRDAGSDATPIASASELIVKAYSVVWHAQSLGSDIDEVLVA
jgi:hypothetical protein